MANYIDGFVFPISKHHLEEYKSAVTEIVKIWKEHGALDYFEFVGDDMHMEGVLDFSKVIKTNDDELVVFGWVSFESKEARNLANERVSADPRIAELVGPLTTKDKLIFDASRMAYAGFKSFIP